MLLCFFVNTLLSPTPGIAAGPAALAAPVLPPPPLSWKVFFLLVAARLGEPELPWSFLVEEGCIDGLLSDCWRSYGATLLEAVLSSSGACRASRV